MTRPFLAATIVAQESGTNERVTLQVTGTPTGGTFTLLINTVPVSIAYNSTTTATATAINAALGASTVTVTGGTFPGATQTVEFTGNGYAGVDLPDVTLYVNALTGGTTPNVTITFPQVGVGGITGPTISTTSMSAYRGIFTAGYFSSINVAAAGTSMFMRTGDTNSSAIVVSASSHATSERAAITFGDWQVGQDLAGNGTKNFFFWNGSPRLQIDPAGLVRLGNGGESMRFVTDNSYLAFFNSTETTRRAYLQATATLTNLVSEVGTLDLYGSGQLLRVASGHLILNGQIRIGSWPLNTAYTGLVDRASGASNNYMIMSDTIDTLISTPGSTGSIRLRPRNNGTDGEVVISNGSTSFEGQVTMGQNGGGAGGGASDANYYNASIYINPAGIVGGATGHTASISFHPGGVAPQLRCGYNNDTIYVQNSVGTDTTSTLSGQLSDTSSRRYKEGITSWPLVSLSAAAPSALDIVRQLRTTTFTYKADLTQTVEGRRLEALKRLNSYNRRMERPDYVLRQHDCAIDGCDGTPDDPCARVVRARTNRLGLIAEEVAEVLPELVDINGNKQPDGIRYSGVATLAIAALQELADRIESLEARLPAAS